MKKILAVLGLSVISACAFASTSTSISNHIHRMEFINDTAIPLSIRFANVGNLDGSYNHIEGSGSFNFTVTSGEGFWVKVDTNVEDSPPSDFVTNQPKLSKNSYTSRPDVSIPPNTNQTIGTPGHADFTVYKTEPNGGGELLKLAIFPKATTGIAGNGMDPTTDGYYLDMNSYNVNKYNQEYFLQYDHSNGLTKVLIYGPNTSSFVIPRQNNIAALPS